MPGGPGRLQLGVLKPTGPTGRRPVMDPEHAGGSLVLAWELMDTVDEWMEKVNTGDRDIMKIY